jgi:hypothetical protein
MSVWEIAKTTLKYTSPVAWLVVEGTEQAAKSIATASDAGVEKLGEEVAKQNLHMQFAQQQARIAQELAIARRIDNAEEVEIEELYDTSGKGNVGLTIDETATFGLGGTGRRVTKRIYRFKGLTPKESEVITQLIDEENKS